MMKNANAFKMPNGPTSNAVFGEMYESAKHSTVAIRRTKSISSRAAGTKAAGECLSSGVDSRVAQSK